jgi:hypothetical protein
MSDFLKTIFSPSQLDFEGVRNDDKFVNTFLNLYRIELFKDGLDLILTKVKEKHLKFDVKIIKGWDTNVGCFLTEKRTVIDQVAGKIFHNRSLKIILRQLSYNVMAHEMAHALEYESKINLGEEFRTAIGYDMKDRDPQIITLKAEIKRLMVEALKTYKPEQFISELFARYFELLSISRNVQSNGDFSTADVMDFFANTTNFIKNKFNPQIKSKIDPEIARITSELAKTVILEEPQQKFSEKVDSFHKRATNSWSKNVKSNANWQLGWKRFEELEGEKK